MSPQPALLLPAAASLLMVALLVSPAVAADVPSFDVTPSCRAAAAAAGATQDRLQTCLASEQRARKAAERQWNDFAPADRDLCARTASAGGMPTYTELVTCLEMARDTKNPPSEETLAPMPPPTTSGMVQRQPRPAQPPQNPE